MPSISTRFPECADLCALANDAANRVQSLWFGFLGFGTFLVVAVSGTSHRDLFLENPISLPLLNLKLPLTGFFIAAPLLLLVFHLFLMVKLRLLSELYEKLEAQIDSDINFNADKQQMRKHLNTSIFLQAIKLRDQGDNRNASLMVSLLIITLVLAPITALLLTQIWFLPYQSEWTTNWHRFLLTWDVVIIISAIVFSFLSRGLGSGYCRRINQAMILVGLVFALLIPLVSWTLLTFPGEKLDANFVAQVWPKVEQSKSWKVRTFETSSLHGTHGSILELPKNREFMTFKTTSLHGYFDTTLQLANEDFVDDLKVDLGKVKKTVVLRERSLIGANLAKTDLREAVFDGADMRGAILDDANLQRASFAESGLFATDLQDASLYEARLQGATLNGANLQGATLDGAYLQGSSLDGANLKGASLSFARLQGALLDWAGLQGVSLDGASLQGASLSWASLQGASLYYVSLQGVTLDFASLQSVSLSESNLQGASLRGASLQGASLRRASLQGASLKGAFVWRVQEVSEAIFWNTHLIN